MKGFVLITVLLFLQVFTLLGLYALQHGAITFKMSEAYFQQGQLLNKAEAALKTAEVAISACEIQTTDTAELIAQPLTFWQSLSCTGNFPGVRYYYVTESLGEDDCADLLAQNATAAYFRITLLAISTREDARVLLQTVVIKPADLSQECHGIHRTVVIGRQTWRQLL